MRSIGYYKRYSGEYKAQATNHMSWEVSPLEDTEPPSAQSATLSLEKTVKGAC